MSLDLLKELYNKKSKHSNYQSIPKKLSCILDDEDLNINSRYEYSRLQYILEKIELRDKRILDIGGNSGFFSIEALSRGAKKVVYYEGNSEHCKFVELASDVLGIRNGIEIHDEYFSFNKDNNKQYDVTFLLNVLHHIGDDYGNVDDIEKAKGLILGQLNSLSEISEYLIFQIGFNWKGDCKYPLFENGTKENMINFIKDGVVGNWDIIDIGIAETENNTITYKKLDKKNIIRNDTIGEFLNRPIFVLKSCNSNLRNL